ncbi:hypothetical protein JDV02_010226 [Purpureocillium takamizusanense]|uniref:Uncharacterized protein n=1 Tax=Purpureocillium takamizusanense TaxID=2060973 RepID=A0A9Q8VF04_9HYPO|nr:uncharacterized protein JDV02_010226 [Purpureocillium takamizusanense]UNI24485.1 hypothetical protein JDV02_010226 [Purpureocillium takamizusanense]
MNLPNGSCIMGTRPKRPSLLRSSVTEPSITTHNALRGSLVNPACPKKATELLSKAWIYPVTRQIITSNCSSERLQQSTTVMDARGEQQHTVAHADKYGGDDLPQESQSDCYFSFPNFDKWSISEPCGTKEPN